MQRRISTDQWRMQWRNEFLVESPNMHLNEVHVALSLSLFPSIARTANQIPFKWQKDKLNEQQRQNTFNPLRCIGCVGRAACYEMQCFTFNLWYSFILPIFFSFLLWLMFRNSYRWFSSCLQVPSRSAPLPNRMSVRPSSAEHQFYFLKILIELYYNKLPSTLLCAIASARPQLPRTHDRKNIFHFYYSQHEWTLMQP